jgi:transcriptional regulator with XRE-family HTH domain
MGTTIRRLRRAKGMSQAALAKRAKLTRVYVTRLEAGSQDPSLSTINALARALGVPVASCWSELLECIVVHPLHTKRSVSR